MTTTTHVTATALFPTYAYLENSSGHGLRGLSMSLVFSHTMMSFSESKLRFVMNVVRMVTIKLTPIEVQFPINIEVASPVFLRNKPLPRPPGKSAEYVIQEIRPQAVPETAPAIIAGPVRRDHHTTKLIGATAEPMRTPMN